ncbi:MAG: SDR family NAD(P)-dependent oxidoreductase [Parvibaculaceae bacterium]
MEKHEKNSLPLIPSFRLDGRTALVSGAGRGLGAAIAAALAEAGAHVIAAARSAGEVAALASALRDRGGSAEALVLDVTDGAAVGRELARRPPVDILVNNAGTNRPKPLVEVSEADYDAVAGLNLKAVFFLTQAVVRRLLAEGRAGSIVNISSQMGHVGAANRVLYCSTKHGLEGFTKALAVELAPTGIRVNSIAPTFIETPMTRPYFENAEFRAEVLRNIRLGRIGVPQDIMGAVVFLASDASALVTGSSLKVDGGWTAA